MLKCLLVLLYFKLGSRSFALDYHSSDIYDEILHNFSKIFLPPGTPVLFPSCSRRIKLLEYFCTFIL